jgi:hypothetical protein
MDQQSKYYPIRKSTRLHLEIPLFVKSLGPDIFSEDCTTVVVNAHGCGLTASRPLEPGTHVSLEIIATKQSTTARVADVVPLDADQKSWLLGMALDQPGNFWGVQYAPADWQVRNAADDSQLPVSSNGKKPAALCRLTAISLGACYLQTTTTFPRHAPVTLRFAVADLEPTFAGTVRVEHAKSGMGIEFTNRDRDRRRIESLIRSLHAQGNLAPQIHVYEQTCHDPESQSIRPIDAQVIPVTPEMNDSLLGLILVGNSLKRKDFFHELWRQMRSRAQTQRGEFPTDVYPGKVL